MGGIKRIFERFVEWFDCFKFCHGFYLLGIKHSAEHSIEVQPLSDPEGTFFICYLSEGETEASSFLKRNGANPILRFEIGPFNINVILFPLNPDGSLLLMD